METIDNEGYSVVVYVDGSARPNPGFYGSGYHGYIFKNESKGKKNTDKLTKYVISDIGYIEADQLLKFKYVTVIPEFYINGYCSYGDIGTNNVAELNAFIESCLNLLNTEFDIKKIVIKADSQYLLGIIKTVSNGDDWMYDPNKPNLSYWRTIRTIVDTLKSKNIELVTMKVDGHSTSLGNNIADRLALIGTTQSTRFKVENKFHLTPGNKYWGITKERHPFLSFKQLFFTNSLRSKSEETIYSIMNYKKDVEPGRKSHEACFGLVILQNHDDYIENAITTYQSYLKSLSLMSSVDLDALYSQNAVVMQDAFGNDGLLFDYKRNLLTMTETQEIVFEVKPAGLATQAIEKLMALHSIIQEYKDSGTSRTYIDITDHFFGLDAKNKVITKLGNGVADLNITVNFEGKDLLIPLVLGTDTLTRNIFKRIEKENVKVTLVLKRLSPSFITYYTIVDMQTSGDISIWHNFYNNNILLPTVK